MNIRQARSYGKESGIEAAKINLQEYPEEMRQKFERDAVGEVVSEVLANWATMADTIYYQGYRAEVLDAFEEAFSKSFQATVEKYFTKRDNPLTRKEQAEILHDAREYRRLSKIFREPAKGKYQAISDTLSDIARRYRQPFRFDAVYIRARRWFQKTYGNTYHSVNITVNGKGFYSGKIYGYGDQYLQTALEMLVKEGYLPKDTSYTDFLELKRRYPGVFHVSVTDVRRERDL